MAPGLNFNWLGRLKDSRTLIQTCTAIMLQVAKKYFFLEVVSEGRVAQPLRAVVVHFST